MVINRLTILSVGLVFFLSFHANAQFVNAGFEDWSTNANSELYPTGWQEEEIKFCYQEADAHSGNFALKLGVWYYYMKSQAIQKTAVNFRPENLTGYYKYTDNIEALHPPQSSAAVDDTASINVYLTKWNMTLSQPDTVATGKILLDSSSVYKPFSCSIIYSGTEIPDSVALVISPSIVPNEGAGYIATGTTNGMENSGYCSFLTIDDLKLISTLSISDNNKKADIDLFPNPVKDDLYIQIKDFGKYTYQITDLSGRILKSGFFESSETSINVQNLSAGIYFLQLTTQEQLKLTKKFIKQ